MYPRHFIFPHLITCCQIILIHCHYSHYHFQKAFHLSVIHLLTGCRLLEIRDPVPLFSTVPLAPGTCLAQEVLSKPVLSE